MVKLLIAGATCMALVAACGASRRSSAPMTAESAATGPEAAPQAMPNDPRAEIERLSAEIDQQRSDLGLAAPSVTSGAGAATPMATVPLSTDTTCKPAKTDKCTQSCTFSDSICTNAQRICNLAQSMPQDTWAADKCSSAKQTCESAHDSCCGCQ